MSKFSCLRVPLYVGHEKCLCLSPCWFTDWFLCGNLCQQVFEMFCFGKSIGEVKLGKWGNHLEIWEKEKLEGPMPVLFFSNNLSWGQTWENLNEVCNWDESRMTSFASSCSVQQEGVGKVLINRNKQKWKGCRSWLTSKNCDLCFFAPDSQWWGVRGARFSTRQTEQRLLLYTKGRNESVSERRVRQAVTPGKDVSDISICQGWNQAPRTAWGPETLTHLLCMCSDASDFALHVWKCFTFIHFSICREAVP